jgi:hypothetical protein
MREDERGRAVAASIRTPLRALPNVLRAAYNYEEHFQSENLWSADEKLDLGDGCGRG